MINVGFTKDITEAVTGCCASLVAGTVIGALCPATNSVMKVVVTIGGGAIGGKIGYEAGKYMADTVGGVCELINENINK